MVKCSPLDRDGAWSYLLPGRPVLEDLARYMRDHTGVYAEIRSTPARMFLSTQLLRDPVHFLFPGLTTNSDPRVLLRPQELDLLGQYLRRGGFLFIDAGDNAADRRFLRSLRIGADEAKETVE